MDELTLAEWKTFLTARISQEQGDDAEALKVFEELLKTHPTNPHLLASRAFALQRLGRQNEAVAARLESTYSELGRTLTGSNDKPEVWTNRLQSLLGDINKADSPLHLAGATIAW